MLRGGAQNAVISDQIYTRRRNQRTDFFYQLYRRENQRSRAVRPRRLESKQQFVARRLCPKCKEPYQATQEEIDELCHFMTAKKLEEKLGGKPLTLWRADGCEQCNHKGFKGRLGIHELLVVDSEIRDAIQHQTTVDDIVALARQKGMKTLLEDGIDKAIEGLTDVKKVLAVCSR